MTKPIFGNRFSINFMWSTLGILALGTFIQTMIITIVACQGNQTFSCLPKIVKILTFVGGPSMLGPLPITVHLVINCWKGTCKDELTKFKILIGTIKNGRGLV